MVNIMISNAEQNASTSNIKLSSNIMVPENLPIENVDLCIILGNLLDNAIEACKRLSDDDEKFIKIEIRRKNAFLIIIISNSFNGEIIMNGNKYESIKINEEYCGIGLSNVSSMVEKYDGDMKISHVDEVFTVSVLLPMK